MTVQKRLHVLQSHHRIVFYLLDDAVKGSLKFVMSRRQFSEIPVSLEDRYDDLVDLVHCLVEATLLKEDTMSTEHKSK